MILLAGCKTDSVMPATVAQVNHVMAVAKKNADLGAELASVVAPETPIAYKMDIHAGEITARVPASIFDKAGDALIGAIVLSITGGIGKVAHMKHKRKVEDAGNQHPEEFNKNK